MSKSYTPGLKILKNTKIIKERKLPLKGDVNCLKMCIDRIIPLTRNSDGISSPKEETPNIIINVNGGSLPEILPAGQGEEVTFVKENDVIATIEQDIQGKKLQ